MSSQEASEAESTIPKTNNNIIIVGSMEEAKKLLGNRDNYVTKEEHEKTADEIEVLGRKHNRLLYEFNFFQNDMNDNSYLKFIKSFISKLFKLILYFPAIFHDLFQLRIFSPRYTWFVIC